MMPYTLINDIAREARIPEKGILLGVSESDLLDALNNAHGTAKTFRYALPMLNP